MSGGRACTTCPDHRRHRVVTRRGNRSRFNGGRWQDSAYSEIVCTVTGKMWRTKAAYVSALPDVRPDAEDLDAG